MDVIIRHLDQEETNLKKAAIEKATAISVSIDLWKSSGAQDIFSVVIFFFHESIEFRTPQMALFRMLKTDGQSVKDKM